MKQLTLLRHAKSSYEDMDQPDFERPLSARGRAASVRIARYMKRTQLEFDLVLCSAAERARETWMRIAEAAPTRARVEFEDALYMTGSGGLLSRLKTIEPAVNAVLLVAHNPDTEILARQLCRHGEGDALARLEAKYPTGGLAEIALDCTDWASLALGCGTLERFTVPRELR